MESVESPQENVVAGVPTELPNGDTEKIEMLWGIVEKSSCELHSDKKELFYHLLAENANIFAKSKSDLGCTAKLKQSINIGTAPQIRQAVRRLPPHHREEAQELLASMLKSGVVKPSSSPWASPIVLVQKKDAIFHFRIEYQKLNEVTNKDAYLLPRIDDTLTPFQAQSGSPP